MQAAHVEPSKGLIRKQILISPAQVEKLERLAKEKKSSVTAMVRDAIDAYDPDALSTMGESELLDLVSVRVKEALVATQQTRERLGKTLEKLSEGGG